MGKPKTKGLQDIYPHTIQELKENIRNEVSAISPGELRVITNLVRRCQECA
jgi:hypothetical protein